MLVACCEVGWGEGLRVRGDKGRAVAPCVGRERSRWAGWRVFVELTATPPIGRRMRVTERTAGMWASPCGV